MSYMMNGEGCGRKRYEVVSKSFRTDRLERELQIVQLSATRCSFTAIVWINLVSFATTTLCVASQRVFIISLSTQSGNIWIHLYFTNEFFIILNTLEQGPWVTLFGHEVSKVRNCRWMSDLHLNVVGNVCSCSHEILIFWLSNDT